MWILDDGEIAITFADICSIYQRRRYLQLDLFGLQPPRHNLA